MTRCKAGALIEESRRRLVVVGVQEREGVCPGKGRPRNLGRDKACE